MKESLGLPNPSSIFITGGAGFIGSRLVYALQTQNPSVELTIFDNLHPQVHGANPTTPHFDGNVTFIKGDVSSAIQLKTALSHSKPQIIYHLAAETGTGQSYDEPTRYCQINVLGTTHLIDAIRHVGGVQKVVLAASRAIYGEGAYLDQKGRYCAGLPRNPSAMSLGNFDVPLPTNFEGPGQATTSKPTLPPSPASIYASTKLMQEYLLTQAGDQAEWSTTILRFQNVYGPGQSLRNPYTGVLSIFSQQLLKGQNLDIFEDGLIARDFVYVDDVVNALILAGYKNLLHGTILDIGLGHAVTILEAAKILMAALGRSDNSYTITGAFRVGDIRHACADISAAYQALGWSPQVSLHDGLHHLAQWAKQEFATLSKG